MNNLALQTVSNFQSFTTRLGSGLAVLGTKMPEPTEVVEKPIKIEELEKIFVEVGGPVYEEILKEFEKTDKVDPDSFEAIVDRVISKNKTIKKKLQQLVSLSREKLTEILEYLTNIEVELFTRKIAIYENEISVQTLPSEELVLMWLQAMYSCKSALEAMKPQIKGVEFAFKFLKEVSRTREFQEYQRIRRLAPQIYDSWVTLVAFNKYYRKITAQLLQIVLRVDQQEKTLLKELKEEKVKDYSQDIEKLSEDISEMNKLVVEREIFTYESIRIPSGFEKFISESLTAG